MGERDHDSTLDPLRQETVSPILESELFNDILDDKTSLILPYSPDPYVVEHITCVVEHITFQNNNDHINQGKLDKHFEINDHQTLSEDKGDKKNFVENILVSNDYEFKDSQYQRLITTNRNEEYLEKCLSHSGHISELDLELDPLLGELELEDVFNEDVEGNLNDALGKSTPGPLKSTSSIEKSLQDASNSSTSTSPDENEDPSSFDRSINQAETPKSHRRDVFAIPHTETPRPCAKPLNVTPRNSSNLTDSGIGDVLEQSTSPSVLDRIISFMRKDSDNEDSSSPSPVCSTPNGQGTQVSSFEFPDVPQSELVTDDQWKRLFDCDGRLINHIDFQHYLFQYDWPPHLLTEAWKFEFDFYRLDSTHRERAVLDEEYSTMFTSQLNAWKNVLVRFERVTRDQSLLEKESLKLETEEERHEEERHEEVTSSSVLENIIEIITNRAPLISKRIKHLAYLIDKDVPRTDRDISFYKGKANANMDILRDLLITYSVYHPDVDYVQGMNDLLSLFLVTTKDPIVAYWCFARYLEHVKEFFLSSGMINKLKGVYDLLAHFDSELHCRFRELEMTNMLFCHRWLLLCFKRESATFQIAVKLFTALNSQRPYHYAVAGGSTGDAHDVLLSLDMFCSVAIMIKHRETLLKVTDQTQVYEWVSGVVVDDMSYVVAAKKMQEDFISKQNNQ